MTVCRGAVRASDEPESSKEPAGTPALRNGTFAFAECWLCVDFAFCEVEGTVAVDSAFSRWLGCTSVTPASRRLFSALTAGAAACQYVADGCSKPQSMEIQRGHHGFQSMASARLMWRVTSKLSKYWPAKTSQSPSRNARRRWEGSAASVFR